MRVGILGGTFDPVHLGHLIIAEEARVRLHLDQVIFTPAGQPWLKEGQPVTTARHRLRMVELAVASNPFFKVLASEIDRSGPTYTVDTLEELQRSLGADAGLYFIVGMDALEQFHLWKEPDRLLELCSLVVASRPGHQGVDINNLVGRYPQAGERLVLLTVPRIEISSTEIRRRVGEGISIRYLVPEAVETYIFESGLYGHEGRYGPQNLEGVKVTVAREDVERLLQLALDRGALKYGDVTLSSGKKSSYYFDGRLLSLDPEGAALIGRALLPLVLESGAEAVGGPTLAADPVVTAVALTSHLAGKGIPAFIVRKEAKGHGMEQLIEGPLLQGSRVCIVDDTCTTGGSLMHAIRAAEAYGCQVVKVVVLLDRREGGGEKLRRHGYDFSALMAANPDGKIEVVSR